MALSAETRVETFQVPRALAGKVGGGWGVGGAHNVLLGERLGLDDLDC
jgi:hypothetical protein